MRTTDVTSLPVMVDSDDLKEKRFTFVLTQAQHAMLHAVAAHERRTAGDWLRIRIEDAYREAFGDKRPKPKK